MIEEFMQLRNKVHEGEFRFDLETAVWKLQYLHAEDEQNHKVIQVRRQGKLKGYAVCGLLIEYNLRICAVYELCAINEETFEELLDRIIEFAEERKADIVRIIKCVEPYSKLFNKKGFVDLNTSVIMIVLLDPQQLLQSLSKKGVKGRILNLKIKGFDPITAIVGGNEMETTGYRSDSHITILMNSNVFLRLFLGKSSFLGETLKGHISIKGWFHYRTALRFFQIIMQRKWYIPYGDWM